MYGNSHDTLSVMLLRVSSMLPKLCRLWREELLLRAASSELSITVSDRLDLRGRSASTWVYHTIMNNVYIVRLQYNQRIQDTLGTTNSAVLSFAIPGPQPVSLVERCVPPYLGGSIIGGSTV